MTYMYIMWWTKPILGLPYSFGYSYLLLVLHNTTRTVVRTWPHGLRFWSQQTSPTTPLPFKQMMHSPVTSFKFSLIMAFLAFFSFLLCLPLASWESCVSPPKSWASFPASATICFIEGESSSLALALSLSLTDSAMCVCVCVCVSWATPNYGVWTERYNQ